MVRKLRSSASLPKIVHIHEVFYKNFDNSQEIFRREVTVHQIDLAFHVIVELFLIGRGSFTFIVR